MNTLAIRVAMAAHVLNEALLARWEALNGLSVYDLNGDCGEWERQEIVLDAASAVDYAAIQRDEPDATALEIVYSVSEYLVDVLAEQFNTNAQYDSQSAANAINHAVKVGLLRV